MMEAHSRWMMLAFLLGALGFLPACMKIRMAVHVNPDASGKLEMSIGLKDDIKSLKAMLEQFGGGDQELPDLDEIMALLDPEEMMEGTEGIVAWSEPRQYSEGKFTYFVITGYFEDVNEVKIGMGEDIGEASGFSFEKLPDGSYALGMEGADWEELLENGGGPGEELGSEAEIEMAKAIVGMVMQDFELTYSFRLPGEITEAQGMETDGRDAKLQIDGDYVMELLTDPEKAEEGVGSRILCKPEGDLSVEMAEFRKEMAAAISGSEEEEVEEPAKGGWY